MNFAKRFYLLLCVIAAAVCWTPAPNAVAKFMECYLPTVQKARTRFDSSSLNHNMVSTFHMRSQRLGADLLSMTQLPEHQSQVMFKDALVRGEHTNSFIYKISCHADVCVFQFPDRHQSRRGSLQARYDARNGRRSY